MPRVLAETSKALLDHVPGNVVFHANSDTVKPHGV